MQDGASVSESVAINVDVFTTHQLLQKRKV